MEFPSFDLMGPRRFLESRDLSRGGFPPRDGTLLWGHGGGWGVWVLWEIGIVRSEFLNEFRLLDIKLACSLIEQDINILISLYITKHLNI